jgi:hypothetical protein
MNAYERCPPERFEAIPSAYLPDSAASKGVGIMPRPNESAGLLETVCIDNDNYPRKRMHFEEVQHFHISPVVLMFLAIERDVHQLDLVAHVISESMSNGLHDDIHIPRDQHTIAVGLGPASSHMGISFHATLSQQQLPPDRI